MKRPNILIITTHDTGRHFGCYGIEQLNTPNVDTLAAEGVRLSNNFAMAPICCPSRATMMTGRYPQSHGLMDLCFSPFDWAMNTDEQHLSHILRDAGYFTRLFGIQHEVHNKDLSRLGFEVLQPPGAGVASWGMAPCDRVAEEVATFLGERREGERPFYAQIGFFETHSPFTWGGAEPDESRGVFIPPYLVPSEPLRRMVCEFQGNIKKMDAAVGVILASLSRCGLDQNTIVIMTTDHGIEFPRAKWTLYDPGLEIALIARWPEGGVCGGRACDRLQSNLDFLPTILDLAGIAIPERVQGHSYAGALTSTSEPPRREVIFALYSKGCQGRCVRSIDFKLIRNFELDKWYNKPVDLTNLADYWVSPPLELYDLRADPLEFNNLAADPAHADLRNDLELRLLRWLEEVSDPILRGPLRTPFYERAIREMRMLAGGQA